MAPVNQNRKRKRTPKRVPEGMPYTVSIEEGDTGPPSTGEHPWATLAGSLADFPYWDEFMEAIEQNRREVDAIHAADDEPPCT